MALSGRALCEVEAAKLAEERAASAAEINQPPVSDLLRLIEPATRTHRPVDPVMTSAEIMLAWDRYTRRIAEAAPPISAEELTRRVDGVRITLEDVGLHRCPHSVALEYCGCAPDRCDAMRERR